MLNAQMPKEVTRSLGQLRQTLRRSPLLTEGLAKLFPVISTRFAGQADTDQHIKYCLAVGNEVEGITGDPRLMALGLWNDAKDYRRIKQAFADALIELRKNKRAVADLEEDERNALCSLTGIENLISEEMFYWFHRLINLDRRTAERDEGRPFYESKGEYEEIIGGLHGEADVRAISLSQVARLENRKKIRELYAGLGLHPDRVISGYAEPTWYVYLPMAYRYSQFFERYERIQEDLGVFEAIALNPGKEHLVETVFQFMGKHNSALNRIKDELVEILDSEYIKLHTHLINDKKRRFSAKVKSASMAAIKAVTDKKGEIGDFSDDSFRRGMNDLVRARFIVKRNANPKRLLEHACNLLGRHGYETAPKEEAHQRKNGIYYAVLRKNGFRIEIQAITEEQDDELEKGERYHEGMLGRRLNEHFGIPAEVNAVLSPQTLRRIESRAITLSYLSENLEGRRKANRTNLIPYEVTVEYTTGGFAEMIIPLYDGSCYADIAANIGGGLLNRRFTVLVEESRTDLGSRIDRRSEIFVEIDDTGEGNRFNARMASEILPHANDTVTQTQCMAAIFEEAFRRRR